jgi:hypothetical protein
MKSFYIVIYENYYKNMSNNFRNKELLFFALPHPQRDLEK